VLNAAIFCVCTIIIVIRLKIELRGAVAKVPMEGVGVNPASRLSRVGKRAIPRLLADLGTDCFCFHDERVNGLKPAWMQRDDVWSFVWAKEMSLHPEFRGTPGLGVFRLWTAIDPETKLLVSLRVGKRTPEVARAFMLDLSGRITKVTTLSTNGLNIYPDAVFETFLRIGRLRSSRQNLHARTADRSPVNSAELCGMQEIRDGWRAASAG
jgi:hypothetical protein